MPPLPITGEYKPSATLLSKRLLLGLHMLRMPAGGSCGVWWLLLLQLLRRQLLLWLCHPETHLRLAARCHARGLGCTGRLLAGSKGAKIRWGLLAFG